MLIKINQLNGKNKNIFSEIIITYKFLKYDKINNKYVLWLDTKKINNKIKKWYYNKIFFNLNSVRNNIYRYMDLYFILGEN